MTLALMLSGIILPHHIGKMPVVVQEELKRLATKGSLQRPYKDNIIPPQQIYDFGNKNIPRINFVYCTDEEYNENEKNRLSCFDASRTVSGTQRFHVVLPQSKSQMLSKPHSFGCQDHRVTASFRRYVKTYSLVFCNH